MWMVQGDRDRIQQRADGWGWVHTVEEVADRTDLVVCPEHELIAVNLALRDSDLVGHLANLLDVCHTLDHVTTDRARSQLVLAHLRTDHDDGRGQVWRKFFCQLGHNALERTVVSRIHVHALADVLPGKARAVPLDDAISRDVVDAPSHIFALVPHLDQLLGCVRDPVQGVFAATDSLHDQTLGVPAEGLGALAGLTALAWIAGTRGLIQAHDIRET